MEADGPAAQAGVQDGDVVTVINGENMLDGTTDTLIRAISAYQTGDTPLTLTVKRGDETFETTAVPF